jgi:TFIIB-like protein
MHESGEPQLFDDYYCFRCKQGYKWELMKATPSGNLFCPECQPLMNPKNEPIRKCPVDNSEMTKKLVGDVFIIDRCLKCGGLWLDKRELEIIKQHENDAGLNVGFAIGLVL